MVIEVLQPRNTVPGIPNTPTARISSGLGEGLNALGAGLADAGDVLHRAQQTNQMNDLRVKMIDGFAAINRDLEADPDPQHMGQRYEDRVTELENTIFADVTDEQVKGALAVTFAGQRANTLVDAQKRAFGLGQGQAVANMEAGLTTLVDQAARADDPNVAESLMAEADDLIQSNVDAGWIRADVGQRYHQNFTDNVANAAAGRLVSADPVSAQVLLEHDGALGLSEADRVKWFEKAKRTNEENATSGDSLARQQVTFAVNALMDGQKVANLAEVQAVAAGTKYEARLTAAIAAGQVLGDFYAAKPADRAAEIAKRKAAGVSNGIESDTLNAMERIHARALTAIEQDPIGYAEATGMKNAQPLDLGDPAAVRLRVALSDTLRKDYGAQPRYFSDAERTDLERQIKQGTVDDQLALVTGIVTGFGDQAHVALDELKAGDPIFAHAGHLVAMSGDRKAATLILSGAKAREAGDAPELERTQRDAGAADTIGGALADAPRGLRETIIDAAKDYYAAKAPGTVAPGNLMGGRKLWKEALQAAAGRTVGGDGKERGGFGLVNGYPMLLPPDLGAGDVEKILDLADAKSWGAASLYGGAPMDGDQPWTPDGGGVVLRAIPGGVYIVGVQRRGRIELLRDPKGPQGIYAVDLHGLAAALPEKKPSKNDPAAQGELTPLAKSLGFSQ